MRIAGLVMLGILVACPRAHAETKTVSWFLSHPDARARVHQLCMNNPGEAEREPDCLNAATAIEQSAMGGVINRIPVKPLAQICAEMPAYQRPFAYCSGYTK
jgi:hypothetical protein